MFDKSVLRIGTRGSELARWQSDWCAERLRSLGIFVEIVVIQTSGDIAQDSSITNIGSQGVFTKEIQRSLLRGEIDLAVHSLKDLPTDRVEGLELAAVPLRGCVRDVFVGAKYKSFEAMPVGSRVGTCSLRRKTQILNRYGNRFVVDEIRGNVATRLRKLDAGEYDAIVLAEAGLERLGLLGRVGSFLEMPFFLPAVGQGAIGLEIRTNDSNTASKIAPLCDEKTFKAVLAERGMLRRLQGGCIVPIGAICYATDSELRLHGRILSMDGQIMIETTRIAQINDNPELLGINVAEELIDRGADKILQECSSIRNVTLK
jgi:hydroxymethylbilane synthase